MAQKPPITTRREHTLFFSLILIGAAVLIVTPLLKERRVARTKVENENESLGALFDLAEAQARYHETHGRYGWLADLASDDLDAGYPLREEDGRRYVTTPGYRIDVLLPHGREGAAGIAIAPRGPGQPPPDLELVKRHFVLVARPLAPGESGWRMWYLDERGDVYLNEGVVDVSGALLNRLPTKMVLGSQQLHSGRPLLWQRLDDLMLD